MIGPALLRMALVAAALALGAMDLRAQCSLAGATHVTWPGSNPVWDFCARRPSQSSGANGSGLELSDVKYNGTLVLFQAHMPILNVKYAANALSCGGQNLCYRDWLYSEQAFQCAPTVSPGICTGTTTAAATVCDNPGFDAGTFEGIAIESLPDRLRLTAQCEAGWYRYIPVWEFFADGTIQALFDATSIDHTCVAVTHHHMAYYRFDVDVNGRAANYVDQVLPDGSTARVTTERNFIDTTPARSKWRVGSPASPYALEIARNPGDGAAGDPDAIPGDSAFAGADGWVLAYAPDQISDHSGLSVCPANINFWDTDQNVNGADVVMWVRAAAVHEGEAGGIAQDCSMVGPTIKVVPASALPAKLNTVEPCRIVDTRNAPGPYGGPALAGNGIRDFVLAGQCNVPMTARSVAVNVTVVQPASSGHFTVFPGGASLPLASTINFSAGQTRANNAVLPLGTGGAVSIFNGGTGAAHVLIDVTGWFE